MIDPYIVERIVEAMKPKDALVWHLAIHKKLKEACRE